MISSLLPCGYHLIHEEQVDSTNDVLKHLLQSGKLVEKPVVMADIQHAGRGRNQRQWISEYGNLFVSCLHPMHSATDAINGYSLAAGLAVREAVAHYLSDGLVQWKWPNDVWVEGKKISGILMEKVTYQGMDYLITGVGINLISSPEADILWPTTSLSAHSSIVPERLDVLKTFVKSLDSYYKRVCEGEIDALIEACLAHAVKLNESITVRLPDKELQGIFQGMDAKGNLILAQGQNICHISAGDVFFKE